MKERTIAIIWLLVFIVVIGVFRALGIDNEFLTMSAALATFVAGYYFGREVNAPSGSGP